MPSWEDGPATKPAVRVASDVAATDHAQAVADPNLKAQLESVLLLGLGITKTSFAATDACAGVIAIDDDTSTALTGADLAAGLYSVQVTSGLAGGAHFESAAASPEATRTHPFVDRGMIGYLYLAATHDVAAINGATGETGTVLIRLLKAD